MVFRDFRSQIFDDEEGGLKKGCFGGGDTLELGLAF